MKKVVVVSLLIMILVMGMTGCSSGKMVDVKALQADLGQANDLGELEMALEQTAIILAKDFFDKDIDTSQFYIFMAENIATEQEQEDGQEVYQKIESMENLKQVYYVGNFNKDATDLFDFVLVYDLESVKLEKFGVETPDDSEMIFKDIIE